MLDAEKVRKRREANATRMTVGRKLDGADEMELAEAAAALAAGDWIVFGAIGDVALVDLDKIFQQASVGIDHGAAELL